MAPFAESRNFRGWWVSKTPLEQKLIILSSVLFILSFCLTISVIVLDNRKPPACPSTTTLAPSTNASEETTLPPDNTPTETETPAPGTPTTKSSTTTSTVKTEPPKPDEVKSNAEGGGSNKVKSDGNPTPAALKKFSSPDITTKEDKENPRPDTLMMSFPDEAPSSRQV